MSIEHWYVYICVRACVCVCLMDHYQWISSQSGVGSYGCVCVCVCECDFLLVYPVIPSICSLLSLISKTFLNWRKVDCASTSSLSFADAVATVTVAVFIPCKLHHHTNCLLRFAMNNPIFRVSERTRISFILHPSTYSKHNANLHRFKWRCLTHTRTHSLTHSHNSKRLVYLFNNHHKHRK